MDGELSINPKFLPTPGSNPVNPQTKKGKQMKTSMPNEDGSMSHGQGGLGSTEHMQSGGYSQKPLEPTVSASSGIGPRRATQGGDAPQDQRGVYSGDNKSGANATECPRMGISVPRPGGR